MVRTTDFHGTSGKEDIYHYLKPGDAKAASALLAIAFQKKILDVLDIGGANGHMLLCLMQALQSKAKVVLCEPALDERTNQYHASAKTYPQHLQLLFTIKYKIEDQKFRLDRKVNIILASHVFYYNAKNWQKCRDLSTHLFTKLFLMLQKAGCLCVILQSIETAGNDNKHHQPHTHEQWEDKIYPYFEGVKHSENKHYANAEMFALALNQWEKAYYQLFPRTRTLWQLKTQKAVTQIPLGNINFTKDVNTNRYTQPDDVNAKLKFYLKGRNFNTDLICEQQAYVLEQLKNHYQNSDGNFVMTHVNTVFCITPSDELHETISVPRRPSVSSCL